MVVYLAESASGCEHSYFVPVLLKVKPQSIRSNGGLRSKVPTTGAEAAPTACNAPTKDAASSINATRLYTTRFSTTFVYPAAKQHQGVKC